MTRPALRHVVPVALLGLAAAAGCDGSLATADVTIPRVCVTEPSLVVLGGASTAVSFTLDLASLVPLLETGSSLLVDDATVVVRSGRPDLSGLTTAAVEALPPTGAPVTLVSMTTPPAAGATTLVLSGHRVNVVPLLTSGLLRLRLVLQGQTPSTAWTADVTTCAHGETHLSY